MKIYRSLYPIVVALLLTSPALAQEDSCVSCHKELAGTPLGQPAELFAKDIHQQVGLSCSSCHGGDPREADAEASMDPRKGFVGAPDPAKIPQFCGSCHASADYMKKFDPSLRVDQLSEYRTSVHGRLLAKGDTHVATCVSCHSVHNIRKVDDPQSPVYPLKVADTCGHCHADAGYMKPYKIPTDQVKSYKASVHAQALYKSRDLSAPTCNDCHGNHGATPPGVGSVANVCGSCHNIQRDFFDKSPHKDAFDAMQLPGCVTCHGNHEIKEPDENLLVGTSSACSKCHEDDIGSKTAADVAQGIRNLRAEIQTAQATLTAAEEAGMEVSRPIYELHDANEKVVQARNQIHEVDLKAIDSTIQEGLKIAKSSHEAGTRAFAELSFRRKGLYVSLLIILLVIGGIYAWIREIEKPDESGGQRPTSDQSGS